MLHIATENPPGFLYDPLKEGELAQCLLRVVAEPEIAKQMGECARYKVKEIINNEKVMKQILNCYERLISARNSSS